MLMDSTMLARLTAEIADWAVGVPIRSVVQPRHDLLALELGRSGDWSCLLIDWSAEFCRMHLAREMPAPALKDLRMRSVLRRHLIGARLAEVTQVNYDRVVRLRFTNCERLGPQAQRTLIAELMGRHSNLVLLDEAGTIIEAGKHVTDRVNRYRQTMPGLAYVPPPEFNRLPPADADAEALSHRAEGAGEKQLGNWLRANFHGCSDLFLREVCARAELEADRPMSALPSSWQEPLAAALRQVPEQAAALGNSYLYYDESGERPEFVYPVELVSLPERRHEVIAALSGALEELEMRLVTQRNMDDLSNRLLSALRDATAKAERVVEHREEALRRSKEGELHRRRGETLMAHLHELRPRQDEVTLPAYDAEGGELTIPLDSTASPLENAQRYFKRYRKTSRLKRVAARLLAAARHNLRYLAQAQTQIELAESEDDLRQIEQELVAEGYLKAAKTAARPASKTPRRIAARRTESRDGYAILYGKSGTENDVVLRAAQPDDWWFHVKGAPGAHVLLRTNSRPEQTPETSIEEAARLAAALSSRRREAKVEVDYTLAKNVTKPRGGRPGLAYYTGARTIVVDLSES